MVEVFESEVVEESTFGCHMPGCFFRKIAVSAGCCGLISGVDNVFVSSEEVVTSDPPDQSAINCSGVVQQFIGYCRVWFW